MSMTVDEYYLDIALAVAKKSTCLKKRYGAIIVDRNNVVLATGYNGSARHEPHCTYCTKVDGHKDADEYLFCPAIHAEQNCIIVAARRDMIGSTLYLAGYIADTGKENVDAEPCEICLRLIKNAGIDKVITRKGVLYLRGEDGVLKRVCE